MLRYGLNAKELHLRQSKISTKSIVWNGMTIQCTGLGKTSEESVISCGALTCLSLELEIPDDEAIEGQTMDQDMRPNCPTYTVEKIEQECYSWKEQRQTLVTKLGTIMYRRRTQQVHKFFSKIIFHILSHSLWIPTCTIYVTLK